MKTFTNLSLRHVIRPANKENAPLLLLLHGYGSNEEDLFSFSPEISDDFFIISARAPYNMVPQGAAWYAINFDATGGKFSDVKQAKESMSLLLKFIEELKAHYPISKGKINILGFSQGAILSYALSLSHPSLFDKVVCMSGYLNEEMIDEPDALESRFRESEKQPTYFISHGTVDQVVPYAWAKLAPDFLRKLNIDHVFKDYPIGHGVARDNFYDMKEWLERDL
ncbi:phospholipase [Nonlabens arenilitoris]|uniref:Phospholipase n=1 Tax=Nonlabens arenilitoris TaxID=1217969 RepID=A0A2S7UCF8_9FLAO|nr:alpha/beta fold hydrolase [Nonlabens arenilitoris]PQJ32628.1 phospholipase [Nonlabens arenilitoris]